MSSQSVHPWEEGDVVEHRVSNWSGPIISYDGVMVTVRPTWPRPKEVYTPDGLVPTPDNWPGWTPITVHVSELRRLGQ